MTRIVMIGAGSVEFCMKLIVDTLHFDTLKNAHFVLMDINPDRLETMEQVMYHLKRQEKLSCTFSATTDLETALTNADFAVSMIQVGGLETYQLDYEIPLKYGIDQCIGDTMNPGGLFRGLRHIPALIEMLRVMDKVSPNIIFMNYANPMAICSWAMQKAYPHIRSVGLCHGVQHTTHLLCDWLNIEAEQCDVLSAGINHMAWFLKFRYKGEDMYPRLWKKLDDEGPIPGEEYRFEMMKAAGYYMTESPGHLSEYLPYFRKRKDLQDLFGGPGYSGESGYYLKVCLNNMEQYDQEMKAYATGKKKVPFIRDKKSVEFAGDIMNAVISNQPFRFAGNVLNKGFITNLPYDCCVEVPVFADRLGLHGSYVGRIPEQCAAWCQSNISFQELAVKASLEGDYESAVHACMMDPLTAAVLAPHEIRSMMDEMFETQMQWLPQFQGKPNTAPAHTIGRNYKKVTIVDK